MDLNGSQDQSNNSTAPLAPLEDQNSNVPPVMNAQQPVVVTQTAGKKFKFGKLGIIGVVAGAVIVFGGGSAAAYFGYVVPNKPENIWKTAMDNTSKGMDKLVAASETQKDIKGMSATGNFKMTGDFATDGTIEAKSYENNASFKFDVGAVTTRVNVEGRLISSVNSTYPDIYIKASGIKGLGSLIGDYGPMLDGLDGQWIAIDHTLLDNLQSSATGGSSNGASAPALTVEDSIKIQKAITDVTKKYVFTSDSSKSILTVASNVGKEKQDDRSVYHYKVTLNKQNTKDFVNAMVDALDNSPFSKAAGGSKIRDTIDMNGLISSIDDIKSTDAADVYVDKSTKLVRAIKFVDPKDTATYIELKVPYVGGDTMPIKMTVVGRDDAKSPLQTVSMSVTSNMKTGAADMDMTFNLPSADSESKGEKMSMKLNIKPSNEKLNLTKPSGAKSVNELLSSLYGGNSSASLLEGYGTTGEVDYSSLLGDVLSI